MKFEIGAPVLRVRDLKSELSFYENDLGLKRLNESENTCGLGPLSGNPIVLLKYDESAFSPAKYSSGLYHYAILVPDRPSLTSTYLALGENGLLFEGFANHVVSESLYLRDPEGNGIEIYCDRPKEKWKFDRDGQILMDTLPLDSDSMILDLSRSDPELRRNPVAFPRGAKTGHMHLKVSNLGSSVKFYHDLLGMTVTQHRIPGACFLSYEGYHHHLALNTWDTQGGPLHKDGEIGLESFGIQTSDKEFFDKLRHVDSEFAVSENEARITLHDPDNLQVIVRLVKEM